MNVIRLFISVLIAALVVISALGIVWWQAPPDALATYQLGGKVVLGTLVLVGLLGLWQLWLPPSSARSLR